MGWDADATKDGEMLEREGGVIADPVLRAAFADAAARVKQEWGSGRMDMAVGNLDGYLYKQVIERATGARCFDPLDYDNGWIGEMHWSPATVLRLSADAAWDFPTEDLIESLEDEICADMYDHARPDARLFLETCAERGLGIRFSW